jgi:hypothetical protein
MQGVGNEVQEFCISARGCRWVLWMCEQVSYEAPAESGCAFEYRFETDRSWPLGSWKGQRMRHLLHY